MLPMPAVHSLDFMDEEVFCFMPLPFSYWNVTNEPQTIKKNPILFPSHYLDLGKRDVFENFIYIFTIMY